MLSFSFCLFYFGEIKKLSSKFDVIHYEWSIYVLMNYSLSEWNIYILCVYLHLCMHNVQCVSHPLYLSLLIFPFSANSFSLVLHHHYSGCGLVIIQWSHIAPRHSKIPIPHFELDHHQESIRAPSYNLSVQFVNDCVCRWHWRYLICVLLDTNLLTLNQTEQIPIFVPFINITEYHSPFINKWQVFIYFCGILCAHALTK